MKVLFVFDDRVIKSDLVSEVIGNSSFGDVLVKKKRIADCYRSLVENTFDNLIWQRLATDNYDQFLNSVNLLDDGDIRIIYTLSNYVVLDEESAKLSFQKINFIEENYVGLVNDNCGVIFFSGMKDFIDFIKKTDSRNNSFDNILKEIIENLKYDSFEFGGLVDINVFENFIKYITGSLDSRFFNSIDADEYTITKSSTDKRKLYAEYNYYKLLPEDMKHWFVQPYDYLDKGEYASYKMERLHMTDLSIKWVHGSIDEIEFNNILDTYFYFFSHRAAKECSAEEYSKISDKLYVTKLKERIETLKKHKDFEKINGYLKASDIDIEKLVEKYFELKKRRESKVNFDKKLVVGHGDPCFSNTLYSRYTKVMKFIDPKGAENESDLWTNPYYDIAKLSHSICGRYDLLNNHIYDIVLTDELKLKIDNINNYDKFKNLFRVKLESEGYDYIQVRIYEASLFLSMLPLHMDDPNKVLAFILNARDIIEEINKLMMEK